MENPELRHTKWGTANYGLNEAHREENLVKKEMIKSANKVASITISNKLMIEQTYSGNDIDKLDYLIAELDPYSEIHCPCKVKGVTVFRLLLTFLTKELK